MRGNISKLLNTGILSLGLLLAASTPAWAENFGTVTILHDALLHGKPLAAGRYNVQWKTHSPEATVQFALRFKVVLFTEGRVERRPKKCEQNAVVYNVAPDGSMSVIEIRFAKSDKVLVFNP